MGMLNFKEIVNDRMEIIEPLIKNKRVSDPA
jgi:hypothetical protein